MTIEEGVYGLSICSCEKFNVIKCGFNLKPSRPRKTRLYRFSWVTVRRWCKLPSFSPPLHPPSHLHYYFTQYFCCNSNPRSISDSSARDERRYDADTLVVLSSHAISYSLDLIMKDCSLFHEFYVYYLICVQDSKLLSSASYSLSEECRVDFFSRNTNTLTCDPSSYIFQHQVRSWCMAMYCYNK